MAEETAVTERRAPLTTRDEDGLMLDQKRLLAEFLEHPDWRQACVAAEIPLATARRWLRDDPAFLAKYNELFNAVLVESKAKLTSLMPRVGEVFEEGLEAQKYIEEDTTCPHCGEGFKVRVEVPAWAIRLRVSENLLKSHGQFTQKVEVSGKVEHEITLEQVLAKALHGRGELLPPAVEADLKRRGLLIEGEYTDVSSEDESP